MAEKIRLLSAVSEATMGGVILGEGVYLGRPLIEFVREVIESPIGHCPECCTMPEKVIVLGCLGVGVVASAFSSVKLIQLGLNDWRVARRSASEGKKM